MYIASEKKILRHVDERIEERTCEESECEWAEIAIGVHNEREPRVGCRRISSAE